MSKPNAITVSRSKRGTTVKARGAAAQALFDAMTNDELARLSKLRSVPHRLHFEDHGQDFLVWDVDAEGKVTKSTPFQTDLWAGSQVVNSPDVGECVRIFSTSLKREMSVKYPVVRVELQEAAEPHP